MPANRPIAMLRVYHAVVAALLRGRHREAATILERARPQASDPLASSFHAMAALIAAQTGRSDAAVRALDLAEASMRREIRPASGASWPKAGRTTLAVSRRSPST
jgi:hypothetical protein